MVDMSEDTVTMCAYDTCCPLPETRAWNQQYCPAHRCKRKAENERKSLLEAELFDDPREFRTLHIRSAPNGFRILVVNDLQRPFHDRATLRAVEGFWNDFAPDLEVYNGDIADLYTISQFDKNPSRRFRLQDEVLDTKRWLFSRAAANPHARRVWIDGNHEDRMRRYLWKHPELSGLPDLAVENLLGINEVGADYLPYLSVLDFLGFRIEHGWKASQSGTAYPINVSRFMASKTGSSGLCGHTHRFSVYSWSDSRGSHSYVENGCLCRMALEYAPFPNWQQAFTYGIVSNNKVHLHPVQVYNDGFRANGEFYPRIGRA